MHNWRHLQITHFIAITSLTLSLTGCGHHPAPICSKRDIFWNSSSEYQIDIGNLPLEDWPKLEKFHRLTDVEFMGDVIPGFDDNYLVAFSKLRLPKLINVLMTDCKRVTDQGLEALTNFPSISGFQLINTSITDHGMQILATEFPNLRGINVERCNLVTTAGFLELTHSKTIEDVGLSLDPLSQKQIENIISTVTNVTWWTITDKQNKLDPETLRRLGESRKITIQVADKNNAVRSITRFP